MKKLTAAQERVMGDIRGSIVTAKSNTLYRYVGIETGLDFWNVNGKTHPRLSAGEVSRRIFRMKDSLDEKMKDSRQYAFWCRVYDGERDLQETICHAPSGTIRALERMGLIEIVHDSANERGIGFDRVRLVEQIPVTSDRW